MGDLKSVVLANMHHAYAQTDGTYAFPNSREGDMLKQAKREIEALEHELKVVKEQNDSIGQRVAGLIIPSQMCRKQWAELLPLSPADLSKRLDELGCRICVVKERDEAIKAVRGLLKLIACCVHITVKEQGKKSLQSDVLRAWEVLEADAKRRGVVLDENWMVDP